MAEEIAQQPTTMSPAARQDMGIGDAYTRIAKAKGPELMGEYGKLAGEKAEAAGKIAGAEAKAKDILASGEADLLRKEAEEGKRLGEEYRAGLRTYEEFRPTQETAADLIGLFGLVSFIGSSMSGQGKYSGLAAMNNMGAAMQGYRQGRKDLFEKEMKEFEKNVQSAKAFNEQQKTLYDISMNQLATNNKAGMAGLRELAQKETGGVADQYVKRAQFEELGKFLEKRIEAFERMRDRMATMAAKAGVGTGVGSPVDFVKQNFGAQLKDKEARELTTISSAMGRVESLLGQVKASPEIVGRSNQIKAYVDKYVNSVKGMGEPPSDAESGLDQKALIFAKDYAAYLVSYERAIAGGAKGFTVALQRRFNELMKQEQFTPEGFEGLMRSQARELASQAVTIAPGVTLPKLVGAGSSLAANADLPYAKEGAEAILRSETAPAAAKTMPSGDKLKAYAAAHFGGDENAAKEFLRSQGYQ